MLVLFPVLLVPLVLLPPPPLVPVCRVGVVLSAYVCVLLLYMLLFCYSISCRVGLANVVLVLVFDPRTKVE